MVTESSAAGAEAPAFSSEGDPLGEGLRIIASAHGRRVSLDALTAGLPLEGGRLPPSVVPRAAARAGLACRLVKAPLEKLDPHLFPVLILTRDGDAWVLHDIDSSTGQARVSRRPLLETPVDLPVETVREAYAGRAFYLRPLVRFDARTPEVRKLRHRHWFWGVIAENRRLYRDVLWAAFLVNLFALALPLFLRILYNRILPNQAVETFWVLASGLAVVFIFDLVVRLLRVRFVDLAAARADTRISAHIMERVLGMRLEHRPRSVGAFAANLQSFEFLRSFITSGTVIVLVDLPFALFFLGVIAWLGWPLVWPVLVGAVVILVYGFGLQERLRALTETAYRAGAQRNAILVESLEGLEDIKSLRAEPRVQSEWERLAAFLARNGVRLRWLTATLSNGALWIQNMAVLGLLAVGLHLITLGELTTGGLIAAYLLASRVLSPISQTAGLMAQYHHASTALEALDKVMATPVEREPGQDFIDRGELQGDIRVEALGFSYPDEEQEVLSGVGFHLKPGERVAVLGRMGSGKSTLARLIHGDYQPTSGRILFDGADQAQFDPVVRRRGIGFVPQHPVLFHGSLRRNLTLGNPQADDETLLTAARITGLDEWVNRHPRGFHMEVGERGSFLSGGQRQSVAIARVLVHDPRILILDEPTSAMDQQTEAKLIRRLDAWLSGRTLILITHRQALLQLVDRILVLHGGRVLIDGPREAVLTALREGELPQARVG